MSLEVFPWLHKELEACGTPPFDVILAFTNKLDVTFARINNSKELATAGVQIKHSVVIVVHTFLRK